jgi:hypothetical protein
MLSIPKAQRRKKHVRDYVSETHFHYYSALPTHSEVTTHSLLARASLRMRKVGGEKCCLIRESKILALAGGFLFPASVNFPVGQVQGLDAL